MMNLRNIMLTILLQWYEVTVACHLLLMPQFLFLAISRYFDTLIEDATVLTQNFNFKRRIKLLEDFTELIQLHENSLM